MSRVLRPLLLATAFLVLAGVLPANSQYVEPCDATCVDLPDPAGSCNTWTTYSCSQCVWVIPACTGTGNCYVYMWEGNWLKHTHCTNGSQTHSTGYAPCGMCAAF